MTCCDFDAFLKAMADETRRRILALLQEREFSVSELTKRLSVTQPTISPHLAILRRVDLIQSRREGRQRFYRANPACVMECCGEMLTRFSDGPDLEGSDR